MNNKLHTFGVAWLSVVALGITALMTALSRDPPAFAIITACLNGMSGWVAVMLMMRRQP